MAATLTIGGTPVTFIEDTLTITKTVDERQRLQCDLHDETGTLHFQKDEQVTLTDPVLGVMFDGVLNTDEEFPLYPSVEARHTIDCVDWGQARASERTYARTYTTAQSAGKLVVDQLNDVMLDEGITQNFAQHYDSTVNNFNQGILIGTASLPSVDDGDLELSKAGSDLTVIPSLSTGTFTNTVYSGGVLQPTTTPTIKMTGVLGTPRLNNGNNVLYVSIWNGSITIHTNDTFVVDIYMPSTNREICGNVNLLLSDGTRMNTNYSVSDQNGVPSLAFTGTTLIDLSLYEQNQWYHRVFTIPSSMNGKVVTAVQVGMGATSAGTYVGYYKNITLSGNTIFSTTIQTNQVLIAQGFNPTATTIELVNTFDPSASSWTSAANSISAVNLVRSSSLVYFSPSNGSNLLLLVSYDGSGFATAANNSALPALPAGSNVAGTSLYFKTIYTAVDPTVLPTLKSIVVNLISAPHATKSDLVQAFETQTQWNTGTLTNTSADVNGNLNLSTLVRNWSDNLTTNQTLFSNNSVSQSASGGVFQISMPSTGASPLSFGISRLDFAGTALNFTIDVDLKISNTTSEAGVTYRQINWTSGTNNTFGYYAGILRDTNSSVSYVQIGYGSNSTNDSYTQLETYNTTINSGTTYHLKIVVDGSHHQIFFNGSSTATIDIQDDAYTQAGNIGLRAISKNNGSSCTSSFDNFVMTPPPTGTWLSPSISLTSLGTCGLSAISWQEKNTSNPVIASALVETSIDGGSTYQPCTNNGGIPNLTSGNSVVGVSILARVTLSSQTNLIPSLAGLVLRVLGAYPGSSGTRSTIPLGNDTMTRSNSTGSWGTSFDSQSYTKVGTGTTNLTGNKGIIAATTGDVHMVLGSRTWDDLDGTVRFSFDNAADVQGMELRYADSNNYYRLAATTTTLSIIQKRTSTTTLASTAVSLSTGVSYWMRFRVVSNGPVLFYGRVWADGVIEKNTWDVTASA